MRIAPLTERVTFQVRQIEQDDIGNEKSRFVPLFSRWASVTVASFDEYQSHARTQEDIVLEVLLRYEKALAHLDTTMTRLLFNGRTYNIQSIDLMQYQQEMVKVRVRLENER